MFETKKPEEDTTPPETTLPEEDTKPEEEVGYSGHRPKAGKEDFANSQPCDWTLYPEAGDMIRAISANNAEFVGTRKEFSKALRGE